jgi:hypothetical protein
MKNKEVEYFGNRTLILWSRSTGLKMLNIYIYILQTNYFTKEISILVHRGHQQ